MGLAHDEMTVLVSLTGVPAPATGIASSDGIGNFLAPDAFTNLGTIFDSVPVACSVTDLAIPSKLPLDCTNTVDQNLQSMFATV